MKPRQSFIAHEGPRPENPTTVMGRTRIRRKMTVNELARAAKVWASIVSSVERGSPANTDQRKAIADALGADVEDLFDETGRAIKLQGVRI